MKIYIHIALVMLLFSSITNAQYSVWDSVRIYDNYGIEFDNDLRTQNEHNTARQGVYFGTDEIMAKIPFVDGEYAKITGNFFSDIYAHGKYKRSWGGAKSPSWYNSFGGIPFAIKANEGDVITMTFDFENAKDMGYVQQRPGSIYIRKRYISKASVLDKENTFIDVNPDSIWDWENEKVYYDPTYNTVAVRQPVDGTIYPFLRSFYTNLDSANVNPSYTITVRKFGKIVSVIFDVDPQASFDITNSDGMLEYNLLRYIRVSAVDTYGNDVPILNSIITQWEIDAETGIARFTPILYPFSNVIDGTEAYETNAANKNASVDGEEEEGDEEGEIDTTLTIDKCMTLEAVNPNMLLLDLNKGGIVTNVANVNASTNSQDVWYDMFGRKYTTKPTAAGLYIHNGKKEVVK